MSDKVGELFKKELPHMSVWILGKGLPTAGLRYKRQQQVTNTQEGPANYVNTPWLSWLTVNSNQKPKDLRVMCML